MDARLDSLTISVSADDVDEAVQFAVSTFQRAATDRNARGFEAPVLVGESFELIDAQWTRVFRFSTEFLPVEVSRARS